MPCLYSGHPFPSSLASSLSPRNIFISNTVNALFQNLKRRFLNCSSNGSGSDTSAEPVTEHVLGSLPYQAYIRIFEKSIEYEAKKVMLVVKAMCYQDPLDVDGAG